jgi:hypothetical protein
VAEVVTPASTAAAPAPEVVAPVPSLPAVVRLSPAESAQMEAAELPEPGPELPADPYLAPAAAARFRRRALVAKRGPLRLSLAIEPGTRVRGARLEAVQPPVEAIAVEERPRSVRVVLADEHLRLVLYAPREMLQPVAVTSAWLSPVADRAADPEAGVRVAAGVVLTEMDRRGTRRLVAGEVDWFHFEGWVKEEAVGEVFTPERFPAPAANGELATGAVITSPQGEVLARVTPPDGAAGYAPEFCCDATLLPGAPAGMQAVRVRLPSLEVRGLVPASAARKKPPPSETFSVGGLGMSAGGVSDTEHVLLRAGAGVYDRAGGRIGTALRETEMWVGYGARTGNDPLVWSTFLFSSFGFLEAQVKPGDLRPYR